MPRRKLGRDSDPADDVNPLDLLSIREQEIMCGIDGIVGIGKVDGAAIRRMMVQPFQIRPGQKEPVGWIF